MNAPAYIVLAAIGLILPPGGAHVDSTKSPAISQRHLDSGVGVRSRPVDDGEDDVIMRTLQLDTIDDNQPVDYTAQLC